RGEAPSAARLHLERRERRVRPAPRRGPPEEQTLTDDARRTADPAPQWWIRARERSRSAAIQRQSLAQPLAPAAVRALRAQDACRGPAPARTPERFLPDERPPLAAPDARSAGREAHPERMRQ